MSEVVSLRRKHLRRFMRDDEASSESGSEANQQWEVSVTGKGEKTRQVQLHLFVMNEMRHYFRERGHASFEEAAPGTPILAGLGFDDGDDESPGTADQPMGPRAVFRGAGPAQRYGLAASDTSN